MLSGTLYFQPSTPSSSLMGTRLHNNLIFWDGHCVRQADHRLHKFLSWLGERHYRLQVGPWPILALFCDLCDIRRWRVRYQGLTSQFHLTAQTMNVSILNQGFLNESEAETVHGHWAVNWLSFSFPVGGKRLSVWWATSIRVHRCD